MFKYWQGYEVDGSDSAYNLIVPDREKVIEIVLYYLSLKTIRRDQRIKISYQYKAKHYSREYSNASAELANSSPEELAEFLRRPELVSVELVYSYLEPNRLFPEVKREIIDLLLSQQVNKQPHLHEPVFWESFATQDILAIYLEPELAAKAYAYNFDVTGEKYHKQVLIGNYYTLEFNCCLGADFGLLAYNLKHMAERFPELAIDYTSEIAFIKEDFYLSGKEIYERIRITSQDLPDTLRRMAAEESFYFAHFRSSCGNVKRKDLLQVYRIPEGIGKWDPLKKAVQYDGEGRLLNDWDSCELDILSGLSGGKDVFTPDEYINYVRKLAEATYFSDTDFTSYSSVNIHLKLHDQQYSCVLRFLKEKDALQMVFDVPRQIYQQVKRKFHLA